MSRKGIRAVVSGVSSMLANGKSLNPVTATSSPTVIPRRCNARIATTAYASLSATNTSGGSLSSMYDATASKEPNDRTIADGNSCRNPACRWCTHGSALSVAR
jgi:hypothetical protein